MSVDRAQIEHLRSFVATPRCMSYETIRSLGDILDDLEAASAEVAALRAQLAERCVVGPDEVVVKREEWAALGQIVTLVNKHINDPCYLRNQLVPIVDKVSALRSGEAGKGVV